MADTKVRVEFVNGKKADLVLENVTPAAIKAAIETAKADGKMIQVRGKLIAPEHIVTIEART